MPVYIEDPDSFKIQKFLIAYFQDKDPILSLIHPDTRREIFHTLVNLPIFGLTFQPTPNRSVKLGFVTPTSKNDHEDQSDDPKGPQFEPEAFLILEPDPNKIPKSIGEAWVLQVVNERDEEQYVAVAEALSTRFDNMPIIVMVAQMKNKVTDLDDGEPVDPKFKNVLACPVVIRNVKKKKK